MKSTSNEQLHSTKYKKSIARQIVCCKCTDRHPPPQSWLDRHYGRIVPEYILKVPHESKFK